MNKKYGIEKLREYNSWRAMRERCYNKNNLAYMHYGKRGITVCAEWRRSFAAFLSDMGHCPHGLTLERVNNDGNYTPTNCVWATREAQARNRRMVVRLLTYKGRTRHLVDWAKELGIRASTLHNRISLLGWRIEEALSCGKSTKWSRRQRI